MHCISVCLCLYWEACTESTSDSHNKQFKAMCWDIYIYDIKQSTHWSIYIYIYIPFNAYIWIYYCPCTSWYNQNIQFKQLYVQSNDRYSAHPPPLCRRLRHRRRRGILAHLRCGERRRPLVLGVERLRPAGDREHCWAAQPGGSEAGDRCVARLCCRLLSYIRENWCVQQNIYRWMIT